MKFTGGTITHRLTGHAHMYPEKPAFIILGNEHEKEIRLTYRQLLDSVSLLAGFLADRQLEGRHVMLVYQDIQAFVIAFLACQYAGVIAVPVAYGRGTRQQARLSAIIEDAGSHTVLCCEGVQPYLEKSFAASPALHNIAIIPTTKLPAPSGKTGDSRGNPIAFIQYTSGSTASPKGVVVSAENLMDNQAAIQNTFNTDEDAIIFSWLPFHHDMGLIGNILHTVYTGCTGILMPPTLFVQSPQRWLLAITEYKVTHSGGPNFAYDLCVNKIQPDILPLLDLSSWKVAFNGAEPVHADTLQRFAARFQVTGFRKEAFRPCYGLAEATLLVAGERKESSPLIQYIHKDTAGGVRLVSEQDADAKAVVSCGGVSGGMDVRIISPDNGLPCGEMEVGEICISGRSVTTGYWNRDNSDVFLKLEGSSFLKTGDLGFFCEGALFVHGRIKEMLIIRGQNFYPYDIERLIAQRHAAIEDNGVAIFTVGHEEDACVVMAEMKRTSLANTDVKQVITSIELLMEGQYGITPYDIMLTTPLTIPRTTSGKLQRAQCAIGYQQKSMDAVASKRTLLPDTARKEKDDGLLEEVLQQRSYQAIRNYLVNIIESRTTWLNGDQPDDQVELTGIGIDSLRAMEIVNIINKELNLNIDASGIFLDNTLSGLINVVENMLWLNGGKYSGKEITI
ncbi:MAG TPA: AMP-binding protein [Chitinophaga sp.]|uniref:AMP-binding protein n=1 Tax=Chitinophaga sp. TaxID=1869181 RepID=UPI002B66F387|nr:AMP-binding protein [Chitinophaga sp.]HVI43872.1 AMP-binding protein [Chitinophaga sp.]